MSGAVKNLVKNQLPGEEGFIVLGAMAVAVVVSIFAGVVASQITTANRMMQWPKISSTMAQVEVQARSLALSSAIYTCGPAGPSSCSMNASSFAQLKKSLPQGDVKAEFNYNAATAEMTGRIFFEPLPNYPNAPSMKERTVSLTIPTEILQARHFECDDATPIFVGFETQGADKDKPKCRALSTLVCPTGQYISAITPTTLEPVCSPAGQVVSCPSDQYINSFHWTGATSSVNTCRERLNPFTEMGGSVAPVLDTTYNNNPTDTADPTPPHPTAPTIMTWVSPATEPPDACP